MQDANIRPGIDADERKSFELIFIDKNENDIKSERLGRQSGKHIKKEAK